MWGERDQPARSANVEQCLDTRWQGYTTRDSSSDDSGTWAWFRGSGVDGKALAANECARDGCFVARSERWIEATFEQCWRFAGGLLPESLIPDVEPIIVPLGVMSRDVVSATRP